MKTLSDSKLLLFVLILVLFSCCGEEPEVKVPLQLPFDSFWLLTEFDESPFTSANEYFDTWIETSKYPAGDAQTHYNYWETKENWGEGNIPDGCQFVYQKTSTEWTITANCILARRGYIEPSNSSTSNWPEKLNYEIMVVANIQTMKVLSANLSFPQFNQVIDFSNEASIGKASPNGYEVLFVSASGNVDTNDSSLLAIVIRFAEIL